MKRCLFALAASVALALGAGVDVASADGNFVQSPLVTPHQSNVSDQEQAQIVPVAPQVNVQNVNVLTGGDVEQGNANNSNTGQAAQQENTQAAPSLEPVPAPAQANDSDQSQVQVVPIAPQVNVQNVNIATHGDVEQGDANNSNTGQAVQQENTSKGGRKSPSPCNSSCGKTYEPRPKPACGGCSPAPSQSNKSKQKQVQVVPIAPQVNVQNVNVFTFGDVEQGNANNSNTGQATQQSNGSGGKQGPPPCRERCQPAPCKAECKPAPKPEPKPCECKPEPKPCECKEPKPQPKPEPKPCGCSAPPPSTCGYGSKSGAGQQNVSCQKQVQFLPIAPQLSTQNGNLPTFGHVEQGNANNTNTGQSAQQSNTKKAAKPENGNGGGPILL
jgi:hypothetical protein